MRWRQWATVRNRGGIWGCRRNILGIGWSHRLARNRIRQQEVGLENNSILYNTRS